MALNAAAGILYAADSGNNRIRRITTAGGVVTTHAGSGGTSLVDGIGTVASIHFPWGIALDAATGTLYIGEHNNHVIRIVLLPPAPAILFASPLPPSPLLPTHQLTAWRALSTSNSLGALPVPVLDTRNATFMSTLSAANTAGLNPAIGNLLLGSVTLAPRDAAPTAGGNTNTTFSTSAQRGLRSLTLATLAVPTSALALPALINLTLATPAPAQQVQLTAGSFGGLSSLACLNCDGVAGLANLSAHFRIGDLLTWPPLALPLITALDVSNVPTLSSILQHGLDGMPALRWLSLAGSNLTYLSAAAISPAKQPALAVLDQARVPLLSGTTCPPGTYYGMFRLAASGAQYFACADCSPGARCDGGTGLPIICGANTYSGGGTAACAPCPTGTYAMGAAKECGTCPLGFVAPSCNATASWRDTITLVADGTGSWVNARIYLVPAGLQPATANVSCGPLTVLSTAAVSCALPFLLPAASTAPVLTYVWVAHAGTGGMPQRLNATVILLPPPPLVLTSGGGLGLAAHTPGTGRIVLRLPAPRPTAADWIGAGLQPPVQAIIDNLTVWLNGALCTEPAWETLTTLSCATLATDATNVAAVVQLASGAFNVSGVLLSLLLSTPALDANTELQLLPPTQSAANTTINITLAGVGLCNNGGGDVPQLAAASVTGVTCASVACIAGRPDAAVCVGWNASSTAAAGAQHGGPTLAVNVSVSWVNPATRPITCDACVMLAVLPVLSSITPTSIAAPGLPVVVTGSGMMDATRTPPTVLIGGEVCSGVVVLTRKVVQCNAPTVQPSAPGFPVVSVVVVNAAGAASTELVNLTYPATFAVSWASTLTLAALPGGVLSPSPTLRVLSRQAASCSLAINVSSCATTNPALASRPTSMTVSSATALSVDASGTSDAAYTDLHLDALEVSGASGCTGTLAASCVDAVGLTASTAGQANPTVVLAGWRSDWNATTMQAVVVPEALPVLAVVFSLVDQGSVLTTSSVSSLSCLALLLPAALAPPPLSQSLDRVSTRDVLSSVSGGVSLINGSAAHIAFAGLSASAARLGQALALYAECTWTSTGERVRLPPLSISTLQLTLAWEAPPAIVLAYTPLPLGLTTNIDTPATASSATTSTSAICEVLLVNATVRSTRLAADTWSLTLDGSASGGTSIPTLVNVTVQAPPATQLYVQASCTVWGQLLTTPPLRLTTASLEARILSSLPPTFIASDASSPWPLEPPLVLVVVTRHDDAMVADVTCSVTASTPATELMIVDTTPTSSLRSIPADEHTGAVAVPRFVVQTSPATTNVTLVVECQYLASGDAVAPLSVPIPATLLTVQLCVPPATKAAVGDPLPSFSVGVAVTPPGGSRTSPCTAALSNPTQLPPIVCTIALNASASTVNDTSSVFLQHTAVVASTDSQVATFDAFTLVVPQGQMYGLSLTCAVGGLAILPPLAFAVEVDGCRAGQASESITCVTCGSGEFSLGGKGARCTGCPPAGATCITGILTLLPHYFRPAAQAGQPLGPDTELHPCYNSEACTLAYNAANASGTGINSSAAIYGCTYGYTGPLCGVCDAGVNYARFGEACALCWDAGASWTFLIAIVVVVLAVLTRVALRKDSGRSDASIVLRITLGYLQAVGSLRVFRAGSTKAYDSVMGWTEVVSASPLSVGALQCILRLPYLFQYVATIALPVLASAAVVVIFHAATTGRSVHCKPRCSMDTAAFRSAVKSWWASKRHLSTLLFVLFLAYMPIVSASLRALDCIDPVAGTRYQRSDLRVECGVGEHAVARALAFTVLVVLGAGFPAGLAWLLGTARNDQLADAGFHATWGFLFDGYRAPTRSLSMAPLVATPSGAHKVVGVAAAGSGPRSAHAQGGRRRSSVVPERLTQSWVVSGDSRVWWEAIVLCRKAGVVLLAVTLTNPYLQCVGASLWFLAATALQLRYAPYTKPLFNRLETASLVTTLLTAIISTALLQYNVGVTAAELHPPDAMTGIEWAVTVALGVMNMGTFVAFAVLWLRAQCARARGIMRRASLVSAVSGRVAGMRASLSRRRSSIAAAIIAASSQHGKRPAAANTGTGGTGTAAASVINPLRLQTCASAPADADVAPSAAPAVPGALLPRVGARVALPGAAIDGIFAVPLVAASRKHMAGSSGVDVAAASTAATDCSGTAPPFSATAHEPLSRVVGFAAIPTARARHK